MSRRDGKSRMPWSVKGVSTEARDLAKTATTREGETMGDWLSDVIRRVGAAQAAGRPLAPPHRRPLPGLPGRGAAAGTAMAPHLPGTALRPGSPAHPAPAHPAPVPSLPAETVDEEALAALVAERLERTETRLVGLLGSLEDIVVRLADRLDRLERSLDDAEGPETDRRSLPPG